MELFCHQEGCKEPGAFMYTWPGKDMKPICESHARKAKSVAEAIGMHLQFIPIVRADNHKEGDDGVRQG